MDTENLVDEIKINDYGAINSAGKTKYDLFKMTNKLMKKLKFDISLYLVAYYVLYVYCGTLYSTTCVFFALTEQQLKVTDSSMGVMVSIFQLFVGIGSFCNAFIVDKFVNTHYFVAVSVFTSIFFLCLAPQVTSYHIMIIFWIIFALTQSVIDCFVSTYLYRLYHLNGPTVLAYCFLIANVWMALLGYVINLSIQWFGKYDYVMYFTSLFGLISCILLSFLPTPPIPDMLKLLNEESKDKEILPKDIFHAIDDIPDPVGFRSDIVRPIETTNIHQFVRRNSIPMTPLTPLYAVAIVGSSIDKQLSNNNIGDEMFRHNIKCNVQWFKAHKDDDSVHSLKFKKYLRRYNTQKIRMLTHQPSIITENDNEDIDDIELDRYDTYQENLKYTVVCDRLKNVLICLSFIFLVFFQSIAVGIASYSASFAINVLNASIEDTRSMISVFLLGVTLGKMLTILLFKYLNGFQVLFVLSTGVLGISLVYFFCFYFYVMMATQAIFFIVLLFFGLFTSGLFCVIIGALSMVLEVTGFLSSMFLVSVCLGGAISATFYGFILNWTDNDYYVLPIIIMILSIANWVVANVMIQIYRYFVKINPQMQKKNKKINKK